MEEALEKAISTIIEVVDPDKIILFGSRAQGDREPESDYDFLVLKKGVKKPRELSRKICRSFSRIGAPADIIVSDSDQYERLKDDPYPIYNEVHTHGGVLYEKS